MLSADEGYVFIFIGGGIVSYRIQIDVYGDRDMNKELTEKVERKGDKWIRRIIFAFLAVMFLLYTKDLFIRVTVDGDKVNIKNQGDTTEYTLETGTIRVKGQKDQDTEAIITLIFDQMPEESFLLSFSSPRDWEHSTVTITDKKGSVMATQEFDGFKVSMAKPSNQSGMLSASNRYKVLAAFAFREVSRWKVNRLVYALVTLLYIAELISYKLWDWVFYRYQIRWAVDRGTLPSFAYKLTLNLSRFALFLLILIFSILSYEL